MGEVTSADFKSGVEAVVQVVLCAVYLVMAALAGTHNWRVGVVVFGILACIALGMCFRNTHKIGKDAAATRLLRD
ncbi:hypothetical protein SAMN04488581_2592 [Mycolicibacterium neoaurum]|uniref:hypothetical protein n=1 Tax=Mycolicibacterium neoaurum TaxID=1795 RepID=UPI000562745A|nr:hypothetical protein [Mycolicibacterium neoaurum]SDD58265.1 hypothetical protein SAMN04488581_2592 [Mycolicibacterium neoaurum]